MGRVVFLFLVLLVAGACASNAGAPDANNTSETSSLPPGGDGIVGRFLMEGASMEPTFVHGMTLDIHAYDAPASVGDIVVFRAPTSPSQEFLKRVIAGPGQQIEIDSGGGVVSVDDVPLDEPYVRGDTICAQRCIFDVPAVADGEPLVPIPEGEPLVFDAATQDRQCAVNGCYFVLGDNRQNSSDSRQGWLLPAENIVGWVEAPD